MNSDVDRKGPNILVPPPFIYVAFYVIGMVIQKVIPIVLPVGRFMRLPGFILTVIGIGIGVWSVLLFDRSKTSVVPIKPALVLVQSGPYQWTRNPMYLSLLITYTGASFFFQSFWGLILIPIVMVVVTRIVIEKEELYLQIKFGEEYRRYQSKVRRWL
jgi:protein-S-isoprenylcysteine O-methyltransferase Ste14